MQEQPDVEPLTESEMAVLRLVAQGVDNQGIAQVLNYSVYTVGGPIVDIGTGGRGTSASNQSSTQGRTAANCLALKQFMEVGW